MRFSERDRPRPRRQEEYDDYAERNIDEGWPYGDDPAAFSGPVRNGPYGGPSANFDEGRNPGFHDADDPVPGGGRMRGSLGSSPSRLLRRNLARNAAGPHRGRAPRGYARSDERIREDVCDLLMEEAQIDPSEVEVNVSGGEVTLDGFVAEKAEKRLAEDWAEEVLGVTHVQNNLRIRRPD